MRSTLRRWTVLTVACALALAGITFSVNDVAGFYAYRPWTVEIIEFVIFLGAMVCVVAGGWLWQRRPRNRCGPLLVAFGVAPALLQASYWVGPDLVPGIGLMIAIMVYRPLTGWLLLAWPSGRLRPGDRRALLVFAAIAAVCQAPGFLLQERGTSAPLVIVPLPAFASAMSHVTNFVVYPVGSVLLFATLIRRRRAMPAAARGSANAAVIAAAIAVIADVVANGVIPLTDLAMSNDAGLTVLGFAVSLFAFGRFLLTGIVLSWAIRWRLTTPLSGWQRIEVGRAKRVPAMSALLAARTGDPAARVIYPSSEGWIDADGHQAILTPGSGRTVSVVERLGRPVAAIDLDGAFDDRPSVIEAAAAAAGSCVEHERLQALALARLDEVRWARTSVLDAEDVTRRRLERDLHDGAQQQLLGLALKARLAAQLGTPDPDEVAAIASGLAAARRDIEAIAHGIMPVVLAEHGLVHALRTLAATTPIGVSVEVDLPDDLRPELASAIWFVITEAVTNSVKHAQARSRAISASASADQIVIAIVDDGVGGADAELGSGLAGLRQRVEGLAGTLSVISPRAARHADRCHHAAAAQSGVTRQRRNRFGGDIVRARVVVPVALTAVMLPVGWVLAVRLDDLTDSGPFTAILTGIVAAFAVTAVVAERRRPGRRVAPLVAIVGLIVLLSAFRSLPSPWCSAVGAAVWLAGPLVIADLLLSYPDGLSRIARRRAAVALWLIPSVLAGAIVAVSGPAADGGATVRALSWSVGRFPFVRLRNPLLVHESPALVRVLTAVWAGWVVAALAVTVWMLIGRLRRADAADRRLVSPIALAGLVAVVGVVVQMLASWPAGDPLAPDAVFDLNDWYGALLRVTSVVALPILAGVFVWLEVLRPQLSRVAGGALQIGGDDSLDESVDDLQQRLRHTLDDPTLRLGFRIDDAASTDIAGWVDTFGNPFDAHATNDRSTTIITRDGAEMALIDCDLAVAERPDDVELAAQLAAVALDNQRLRSLTLAQAEVVRASGERLLQAADRARHSLERDLTVGPAALLAAAESALSSVGAPSRAALERAADLILQALAGVRKLSHGLAPPTLDQIGLAAALEDLAGRSDALGDVSVPAGRLARPIEATLYASVALALEGAVGPVDVKVVTAPGEVSLHLAGRLAPIDDLVTDRVGALDGTIIDTDGGRTVQLPLTAGGARL